MKKIILSTIALALLVAHFSCREGRTTTIRINDDSRDIRIQYSGRIVFDDTRSQVVDIEPEGFLEYRNNGKELLVRRERSGRLKYEIDGVQRTGKLSSTDSLFVAGAVREIVKVKRSSR